jgi:hypothetical protein
MNPNLKFGQVLPGKSKGRPEGIIETRHLVKVVDAVGLIEGSGIWTWEDGKGLRDWFRKYLNWLRTDGLGKKAGKKENNNHGTWYDVQIVTFALYVGENAVAREVLERSKSKEGRIAVQIGTNGEQLKERARSDSFHYYAFNLEAFATLADLGVKAGVDLWKAKADGRSITGALDFMVPYATGDLTWPPPQHRQDKPIQRGDMLLPLRRAAVAVPDPSYEDAFDRIDRIVAEEERLDYIQELLHPPGPAKR